MFSRTAIFSLSIFLSCICVGAALAQSYPTKPLRIVTSGVGGGSDFFARQLAQTMSKSLGQAVIVDNRSTGSIPGEVVARSPADGYTILLDAASVWISGLLQVNQYDPIRDFAPISLVERSPLVLVINPTLSANSVKELIALAKAKPGTLNYGSGATGGSFHLASELFNYMSGVRIVRVAFKGGGPLYTAVIAGEVQLTFASAGGAMPHIKAGRLKPLAVSSSKPSALFPGIAPIASSGVPGYEWVYTQGVLATARTPAPIIRELNEHIVRALNTSEMKERFFNTGVDVVTSTPDEFASVIKSEISVMSKLIKDLGIRAD